MKTNRYSYPTISEVAHKFGVSRTRIFNLLRQKDIIGSQGLVRVKYLHEDFFVQEVRSRFHPGINKDVPYVITTVTPKGKSFIQDLLDDAGIETPNRLHAPRIQPASQNA